MSHSQDVAIAVAYEDIIGCCIWRVFVTFSFIARRRQIPLLAEKGPYPNVDRVLVVDVEPETQISRLMARDNSTRKQAEQALAAQANRGQRLKIADDILDNSGSPEQARLEVAKLHQKYSSLALGE